MKVFSVMIVQSAYDISVNVFRTEDEAERFVINKATEHLADDDDPREIPIDGLASARAYLETQVEYVTIEQHTI